MSDQCEFPNCPAPATCVIDMRHIHGGVHWSACQECATLAMQTAITDLANGKYVIATVSILK